MHSFHQFWMALSVRGLVHNFGPEWNILTFGWKAITLSTDIHGSKMMYPNDFSNRLTFALAPSAGWHFWIREEYLWNYWMDCYEIWYRYSCLMCMCNGKSVHRGSCVCAPVLLLKVFLVGGFKVIVSHWKKGRIDLAVLRYCAWWTEHEPTCSMYLLCVRTTVFICVFIPVAFSTSKALS